MKIAFADSDSQGKPALVASFDLQGFSEFCKHPDAHQIVPKFISGVFQELNDLFLDSLEEFLSSMESREDVKVIEPDVVKYTGDGAIMIWLLPSDAKKRAVVCRCAVTVLRKFQNRLTEIIPQWEEEWQAPALPKSARFGIARGTVYPLRASSDLWEGEIIDYVGYCINLAVRLQDHCREVGFLVHQPVLTKTDGFISWTACNMKGVLSEPVLMYGDDFERASKRSPDFTTKFSR